MVWVYRSQPDGVDEMIRYFDDASDARLYKDSVGCGGWIFVAENGTAALFPANYTPSKIMNHQVTRGVSGRLEL